MEVEDGNMNASVHIDDVERIMVHNVDTRRARRDVILVRVGIVRQY